MFAQHIALMSNVLIKVSPCGSHVLLTAVFEEQSLLQFHLNFGNRLLHWDKYEICMILSYLAYDLVLLDKEYNACSAVSH